MAIDHNIGSRSLSPKMALVDLINWINKTQLRVLREMRDALNRWLTPGEFTFAASVPLDVTVHTNWAMADTVTGAMEVQLQNGIDELSGSVYYKQDGIGHIVSYAAVDRTTRYFGTQAGPNQWGWDSWQFVTVNAALELWIVSVAA